MVFSGLMFALLVENTLYLKADADARGDFDALGFPLLATKVMVDILRFLTSRR
jgi:TfoX/Sxy family transcriptional regulator of competence genes